MKLGSLFSGIGGAELAASAAGIETAWMVEKDPFAQKVLRYRFPGVPLFDDVQAVGKHNLESVDVISAGWPCQDLSVAGKRLGMKGERSGLFYEAIRIIRELRPTYFVGENVPGLFSSAGGWDFAAVLDEMADSGALDIAWRVLDAQWFGVPQRRRRIFLIADFRGERAGEILSISEGVQRYPAPGREAGPSVTALSANGVGTCGADDNQAQGNHLVAADAFGSTGRGYWAPGVQTIRERDYKGEANLVAHALTGEGHDASEDGTGRGTPLVPTGFYANSGYKEDPVSGASAPLKGSKENAGQAAVAVGAFCAGNSEGAGTIGYEPERRTTLRGSASGTNMTPTLHQGMAVRRLTPTECERLQGFPDGWTDIPGASDSGRYRALGNAWAVPVGAWVMKGITGVKR